MVKRIKWTPELIQEAIRLKTPGQNWDKVALAMGFPESKGNSMAIAVTKFNKRKAKGAKGTKAPQPKFIDLPAGAPPTITPETTRFLRPVTIIRCDLAQLQDVLRGLT